MDSHAHSSTSRDDSLRVVSANVLDGGVDDGGGTSRMQQTVNAVLEWDPDIVLAQELRGTAGIASRHWWAWANALGMTAVALGPPRGSKEQRCAIFARSPKIQVLESGPAPVHDRPGWAEAIVLIKSTGTELRVISDHAQATTAAGQLSEAERQAARAARTLSIIGGDRNNYSPEDDLADSELTGIRTTMPHVASSRLRLGLDGKLTANYDVHQVLTSAGLVDPVPHLAGGSRFPAAPGRTASGPGRIDRFYMSGQMLPAVRRYDQRANPGSDHQMLMVTLSLSALARVKAPEPGL